MKQVIYFDIDGTLTKHGDKAWGEPDHEMLQAVRELISSDNFEVIIWSACGTEYSIQFCQRYGLSCLAISKPHICIDDRLEIRPEGLNVKEPQDFLSEFEMIKNKRRDRYDCWFAPHNRNLDKKFPFIQTDSLKEAFNHVVEYINKDNNEHGFDEWRMYDHKNPGDNRNVLNMINDGTIKLGE